MRCHDFSFARFFVFRGSIRADSAWFRFLSNFGTALYESVCKVCTDHKWELFYKSDKVVWGYTIFSRGRCECGLVNCLTICEKVIKYH